jgi:diguanylate cyclase (GGDEF)-like protein
MTGELWHSITSASVAPVVGGSSPERLGLWIVLAALFVVLRFEARRGIFLHLSSWSWLFLVLGAVLEQLAGSLAEASALSFPVSSGLELLGILSRFAFQALLVGALVSLDRVLDKRAVVWLTLLWVGGGWLFLLAVEMWGWNRRDGQALLEGAGFLAVVGALLRGMRWRESLGWRFGLVGTLGQVGMTGLSLFLSLRGLEMERWVSELAEILFLGTLAGGCLLIFSEEMRRELASAHARLEILVDRLERERNLDVLTGAFNRTAFEERVGFSTLAAGFGSLAVCDLDDLKAVNDGFGHEAGDQLVREFAQRLRRKLRHSDLIYRIGGDEFVVVLERLSAGAAADRLSEIFRSIGEVSLEGTKPGKLTLPIRVSFGVAEFRSLEELPAALRKADRKMYEMKRVRKSSSHLQVETGRLIDPELES